MATGEVSTTGCGCGPSMAPGSAGVHRSGGPGRSGRGPELGRFGGFHDRAGSPARGRGPQRGPRPTGPTGQPTCVLGVFFPRDPQPLAQARYPDGDPRPGRPATSPTAAGKPGRQATGLRPRDLQALQHVERCINRLKQWRGIATRYEKTATICLAGLHVAGSVIQTKPLSSCRSWAYRSAGRRRRWCRPSSSRR